MSYVIKHFTLPCGDTQPQAWGIGNVGLLEDASPVGLFSSRRCAGSLIVQAAEHIAWLAEQGRTFVGGFHSPVEQQWLNMLLRRKANVILCPARSIHAMRLPKEWAGPIEQGRLLILSPFDESHPRVTRQLTTERNRFVAELASEIFLAHATPGGQLETLLTSLAQTDDEKPIYALAHADNTHLLPHGIQTILPGDLS